VNGVGDGYRVAAGMGVTVGIAARVDATACWIWMLGSGVAVVFGAQDVKITETVISPARSEHIFFMDVIIQSK
jgi:hypothetical protein